MRTTLALLIIVMIIGLFAAAAIAEKPAQKYEFAVDTSQFVEGLDSIINVVEEKIDGPLATYYVASVRKIKIASLISIIISFLSSIFSILIIRFSIRAIIKNTEKDRYNEQPGLWTAVVLGSISLFVMINIMGCSISNYLTADYCAMRDIIETTMLIIK